MAFAVSLRSSSVIALSCCTADGVFWFALCTASLFCSVLPALTVSVCFSAVCFFSVFAADFFAAVCCFASVCFAEDAVVSTVSAVSSAAASVTVSDTKADDLAVSETAASVLMTSTFIRLFPAGAAVCSFCPQAVSAIAAIIRAAAVIMFFFIFVSSVFIY